MEGDAGTTSRLSSSDADDTEVMAVDSVDSADETDRDSPEMTVVESAESTGAAASSSRLGRGALIGTAAALAVAAGAVGAGGYLALHAHRDSEAMARANVAALNDAKECITAINAPDAEAMYANLPKVIECTTEDLGGQIPMFGVAAEAYATYGIHTELLELRAAVERNNEDGSIDILAALRQQTSTTGEQSQRLRLTVRYVDGQYKIAKIDRVGR